jgi:tRNA A37 N6-isopentenylltransferase MiaA
MFRFDDQAKYGMYDKNNKLLDYAKTEEELRNRIGFNPDKYIIKPIERKSLTLDEVINSVKFAHRRYGKQFYTWASVITATGEYCELGDPYPASRFPKELLMQEITKLYKEYNHLFV